MLCRIRVGLEPAIKTSLNEQKRKFKAYVRGQWARSSYDQNSSVITNPQMSHETSHRTHTDYVNTSVTLSHHNHPQ